LNEGLTLARGVDEVRSSCGRIVDVGAPSGLLQGLSFGGPEPLGLAAASAGTVHWCRRLVGEQCTVLAEQSCPSGWWPILGMLPTGRLVITIIRSSTEHRIPKQL